MNIKKMKIYILGSGGHGKTLFHLVSSLGYKVDGFVDIVEKKEILPIIKEENFIAKMNPKNVMLINGIGSVSDCGLRATAFEKFKNNGFNFLTFVHPTAFIAPKAKIGEGTLIFPGAIVQVNANIEDNVLINTGVIVEHDVRIHRHSHISPGAVICGESIIGSSSHIGAGSTIIQGVHVGNNVLVAAGAVVTSNIDDGRKAKGIPARSF